MGRTHGYITNTDVVTVAERCVSIHGACSRRMPGVETTALCGQVCATNFTSFPLDGGDDATVATLVAGVVIDITCSVRGSGVHGKCDRDSNSKSKNDTSSESVDMARAKETSSARARTIQQQQQRQQQ